jgi:hypothetical protein
MSAVAIDTLNSSDRWTEVFPIPGDQGRWSNLFGDRFRERLDPTSVFVQRAVLHRRKRTVCSASPQATNRYAVTKRTTLADDGYYSSMFCTLRRTEQTWLVLTTTFRFKVDIDGSASKSQVLFS